MESPSTESQAKANDAMLTSRPLSAIANDNYTMSWLHKGWSAHMSYGMVGGAEKTLKSWIEATECVCTAAGLPLFDRFPCVTQGPVLVFTGEVNDKMYYRRVLHIGRSLGLTDAQVKKLPIHVADGRANTTSHPFQSGLRYELERHQPVRVSLDPLYSYHGTQNDASNLHQAAEVLNAVSDITSEYGVSLRIVNHFRKDAYGRPRLMDLTQAGGREWADSWLLLAKKGDQDVAGGNFNLAVEVGSRHWGGASYDLALSIGTCNLDTFEWEGAFKWNLTDFDPEAEAEEKEEMKEAKKTGQLHLDQRKLKDLGKGVTVEKFQNATGYSVRKAADRLRELVKAGMAKKTKHGNQKVGPSEWEAVGPVLSVVS